MSLLSHVTQLVNDIGKTITLRTVVEGTYDIASGSLTGGSTTDTEVKAMFLGYDDPLFDGEIIQRGDRKVVIRASDGVEPKTQDILIEGSTQYKVISVRQIEQAGTDVVYICQARQ